MIPVLLAAFPDAPQDNRRTPLVIAVSLLFYFDAFAWGVGVVPTLYYAFTYKVLPTVAGIRLLAGPFESLGIDALIVAGIVFVYFSSLKVLAATGCGIAERMAQSWAGSAMAQRHVLVRLRAAPRTTAWHRRACALDRRLEDPGSGSPAFRLADTRNRSKTADKEGSRVEHDEPVRLTTHPAGARATRPIARRDEPQQLERGADRGRAGDDAARTRLVVATSRSQPPGVGSQASSRPRVCGDVYREDDRT